MRNVDVKKEGTAKKAAPNAEIKKMVQTLTQSTYIIIDHNTDLSSIDTSNYHKFITGKALIKITKTEKGLKYNKNVSKVITKKYLSFVHFLKSMVANLNFNSLNYTYVPAFTYFPMKDSKRKGINAYIIPNTSIYTCIDIDFKNKPIEYIQKWKEEKLPILQEFLSIFPNSYAIQISKSGLGFHIYLLLYIDKQKRNDKNTKYDNMAGIQLLFSKLKEISKLIDADINVYDKSRYIISSPNPVFYIPKNSSSNITNIISSLSLLSYKYIETQSLNNNNSSKNSNNNSNNSKKSYKYDLNQIYYAKNYSSSFASDKKYSLSYIYNNIISSLSLLSYKYIENQQITQSEIPTNIKFNNKLLDNSFKYFSKKFNSFENFTLDEFIRDLKELPANLFKVRYGKTPTLAFENMCKILANELKKREVIKENSEFIVYNRGNKRWVNIRISPYEKSTYDLFTYPDTDCVWFQSENAIRHLGQLGKYVQGVELDGEYIDQDTGEVTYFYKFTGKTTLGKKVEKPCLSPQYFGFLFVKIARNWNIDVPDEIGYLFAKKYEAYIGSLPIMFYAEQLLIMISDALKKNPNENNEVEIKISDYIPTDYRSGVRAKTWNMIVNFINDNYSEVVEIRKGKNNALYLTLKHKFKTYLNSTVNIAKAVTNKSFYFKKKLIKTNKAIGVIAYLVNLLYIVDRKVEDLLTDIVKLFTEKASELLPVINVFEGYATLIILSNDVFGLLNDEQEKEIKEYLLARIIAGRCLIRYTLIKLNENAIPIDLIDELAAA
jgi:hypothetical protein